MKERILVVVSIFFSLLLNVNAKQTTNESKNQVSYQIKVSAPILANDSVYLARYFGGKIYAQDTLLLDKKGVGIFRKDKALQEGLYLLYLGANSQIYEFLIGKEQNISLSVKDTSRVKEVLEVFDAKGNQVTEDFIEMGRFITKKRLEAKSISDQIHEAKDSLMKKALLDKQKSLGEEVETYQGNLRDKHSGDILGVFMSAIMMPKFPKDLQDGNMKDTTFLRKRYQYAKDHYWDNYNLSDRRSWNINTLNNRLDEYMKNWLIQIPDTITNEAVRLIELSKEDSICFQLMTNYMINLSVQSKVMGMDRLLVELDKRYYKTGLAFWADSTLLENIDSEVRKSKYNLIGMNAWNLPLVKPTGQKFHLYDVKSPFTLLYFYEPSCGHCKATTPKIRDIYKKYHQKGFEVVAVYLLTDEKEWSDFIKEIQIGDWINAWDPERKSYYWQFFDTSTTPGVYLLDKDKKIVAKKIDSESLERILEFELVENKKK